MLFVVVSTRDGYNVIIQTHSCMKMFFVVVSTGDGYNVMQRQESTGFEITEDSIVDKLHWNEVIRSKEKRCKTGSWEVESIQLSR